MRDNYKKLFDVDIESEWHDDLVVGLIILLDSNRDFDKIKKIIEPHLTGIKNSIIYFVEID